MNYQKVWVDEHCRKINTEGMNLAQSSSDNELWLYSKTKYAIVRVTFRLPTGSVHYDLHMAYVGYDEDEEAYLYSVPVPYTATHFTMPSATAKISVSFHCWQLDDFSKGGEAVCDTAIIVNRSSTAAVYDPSYNGADIESIWRLLGQTAAEITDGVLLIHVLASLPATTVGYELGAVVAVLADGDISFYKNQSSAWVKHTFKDLQTSIQANATAIANEATARYNGDNTLQYNLDVEADERMDEDAILQNGISANSSAVAQEVLDRQAADSAEALTRGNADTALAGNIATVASIANGKTSSYAISNADPTGTANSAFVSTVEILVVTGLTKTLYTTAGATVPLSALKLGDVVFVTQSAVPDRWVSAIGATTVSFTRIEEKADLTGYARTDVANIFTLKQTFSAGISNGTYDYVLPSAAGTFALLSDFAKIAFNNANASLDGLRIGSTSYKTVPCGNAGTDGVAEGTGSVAGINGVANGVNSNAGQDGVANGRGATAGTNGLATGRGANAGQTGTSVGNGAVSGVAGASFGHAANAGDGCAALGPYVSAKIHGSVTVVPTSSGPSDHFFAMFSPDRVFFLNEFANAAYTTKAQYVNGRYLAEYIGAGSPTVVTETMANLVANTSAYFDVTGAGTSVSPYLVKPKTTLFQPHAHRLYQIAISTAPVANTYIDFQSSNTERCEVQLTSTLNGAAMHYYINFKNIAGYIRSRNPLNGSTLVNTPIDTSTANAIIVIDLNSPEMYTTYAL